MVRSLEMILPFADAGTMAPQSPSEFGRRYVAIPHWAINDADVRKVPQLVVGVGRRARMDAPPHWVGLLGDGVRVPISHQVSRGPFFLC